MIAGQWPRDHSAGGAGNVERSSLKNPASTWLRCPWCGHEVEAVAEPQCPACGRHFWVAGDRGRHLGRRMLRPLWCAAGLWFAGSILLSGPLVWDLATGASERHSTWGRCIETAGWFPTVMSEWLLVAAIVWAAVRGALRGGSRRWLWALLGLLAAKHLMWPVVCAVVCLGMGYSGPEADAFPAVQFTIETTRFFLSVSALLVAAAALSVGVGRSRKVRWSAPDGPVAVAVLSLTALYAVARWGVDAHYPSLADLPGLAWIVERALEAPVWLLLLMRARRGLPAVGAGSGWSDRPGGPSPAIDAPAATPNADTARQSSRKAAAPAWLRCPNCDYSLYGLSEPTCPECGTHAWLARQRWRLDAGWRRLLAWAAIAWAASRLCRSGAFLIPLDPPPEPYSLWWALINGHFGLEMMSVLLLLAGAIWGHVVGGLRQGRLVGARGCIGALVIRQFVGWHLIFLIILWGVRTEDHWWLFWGHEPVVRGLALLLLCLGIAGSKPGRSTRWEILAAALVVAAAVVPGVWWGLSTGGTVSLRAVGPTLAWYAPAALWLWVLWRMRRAPGRDDAPD